MCSFRKEEDKESTSKSIEISTAATADTENTPDDTVTDLPGKTVDNYMTSRLKLLML